MGASIGCRLKCAAIFLAIALMALMAFLGSQPMKADARANLTAYLSAAPSSWEPARYNVTGTAPWFVVQMLGYNATDIMGNVGIGDGSVLTLNNLSNRDVEYSENYFIGADISTAPWDSRRLTSSTPLPGNAIAAPGEPPPSNATASAGTTASAGIASTAGSGIGHTPIGNASAGNGTIWIPNIGSVTLTLPDKIRNHETSGTETTSNETTSNETTGGVPPTRQGPYTPLNDRYHSILMGRPVGDMVYEYPLEIIGGMYARLVGLRMPDGSCANMGIRCLGYGY